MSEKSYDPGAVAIERMLRSNLDSAIALIRLQNDAPACQIATLLEASYRSAVTLGLYQLLADRTDVSMLAINKAIVATMQEVTHALRCSTPNEAVPSVRLPSAHRINEHLVLDSLPDADADAGGADHRES